MLHLTICWSKLIPATVIAIIWLRTLMLIAVAKASRNKLVKKTWLLAQIFKLFLSWLRLGFLFKYFKFRLCISH